MRFTSRWNLGLLLLVMAFAMIVAGCTEEAPGAEGSAESAETVELSLVELDEDNLLPNPGWTEGFDDEVGAPVGWLKQGATTGQITDELAYTGKYSFKGVDEAGSSVGIRTPRIAVKPGERYELSVYVRTKGGMAWAGIETWEDLESTTRMQLVQTHESADNAWVELKVPYVIPDDVNAISVILYTLQSNSGTAYWNSPKLVKVEE